jgi:uncharacterized protein
MSKSVVDDLRHLHTLLEELREVQEAMARGPRLAKAKGQFVVQKGAEVEAARLKQRSLKMIADQKNLQLKTGEAKLSDLQGKLNQAVSNREYGILSSQIEADTVAKSVLEDEILETLEMVEVAGGEIKKLEQELVAAKAEEARALAEVAAAEAGLKEREAKLKGSLPAAEAFITGEARSKYARMVQAYGVSSMAEVSGNTCSSCYMSMPPQTLVQLRSGEVVFCKSCGRLLFIGMAADKS